MNKNLSITILAVLLGLVGIVFLVCWYQKVHIERMVYEHAKAWETGDDVLLASLLHEDSVFAYPGRRLTKEQTLDDLRYFRDHYTDTKVYVSRIVVEGNEVAVEWQFATTNEKGQREVVSDAIIATVKDGQFLSWKEYLDGRVKGLQAEGRLELEEGQEPFPWPAKTSTY